MTSNFHLGQVVYIAEHDPDGEPLCANGYTFVCQVDRVVIVRGDVALTKYSPDSLITRLLTDTAAEEDTMLCVFPVGDCYPTWERADRAIGRERLRKEREDEF